MGMLPEYKRMIAAWMEANDPNDEGIHFGPALETAQDRVVVHLMGPAFNGIFRDPFAEFGGLEPPSGLGGGSRRRRSRSGCCCVIM